MDGIIFDIQHYAIYDGPGIRTCVFFKGCPLKCAWCHNPESQLPEPQIGYLAEKCTLCGECAEICGNGAITLENGMLLRDPERCKVCGECAAVCLSSATEMIGRSVSAGEVIGEILGDRLFYETSGGGVTLSGGEPTVQPEFMLDVLKSAKKEGLHTTIETCGYVSEKLIDKLPASVDLFLYDIKHVDAEAHQKFIGASNQIILSNFEKLLATVGKERITPRIPLIPGFNTDDGSIDGIASFIADAGYRGPVDLMPYNGMARSKWEKIGRGSSYVDFGTLSNDELESVMEKLGSLSLAAVCNS